MLLEDDDVLLWRGGGGGALYFGCWSLAAVVMTETADSLPVNRSSQLLSFVLISGYFRSTVPMKRWRNRSTVIVSF